MSIAAVPHALLRALSADSGTRFSRLRQYVSIAVVMFLVALPTQGQVTDPSTTSTLQEWASAAFQLGITLIVLAAAIFIALGAYLYFAAAGNAGAAQTGKEYISRAIMGLVLGLIAWVILNTISPQFTTLKEPSL